MNVYGSNNDFEEQCKCGCRFMVHAPQLEGHNETEEYKCPKCGKEFTTKACVTPRTDILEEKK